eukprot:TRINITY_DN7989_c3_g1_i1.p1 TRINITY_DN7989_c3_g1~~TRINITY_DN7989_c3_g1_i1.p1  ORF type:complete len:646 (+),score=66.19 TRINITY_DN7989_c3_g1_i1:52-1989(+)
MVDAVVILGTEKIRGVVWYRISAEKDGRRWTVAKRYRDFLRFERDNSIRMQRLTSYDGVLPPQLPEKGHIGFRKALNICGFREQRLEGLRRYLVEHGRMHEKEAGNSYFWEFLEYETNAVTALTNCTASDVDVTAEVEARPLVNPAAPYATKFSKSLSAIAGLVAPSEFLERSMPHESDDLVLGSPSAPFDHHLSDQCSDRGYLPVVARGGSPRKSSISNADECEPKPLYAADSGPKALSGDAFTISIYYRSHSYETLVLKCCCVDSIFDFVEDRLGHSRSASCLVFRGHVLRPDMLVHDTGLDEGSRIFLVVYKESKDATVRVRTKPFSQLPDRRPTEDALAEKRRRDSVRDEGLSGLALGYFIRLPDAARFGWGTEMDFTYRFHSIEANFNFRTPSHLEAQHLLERLAFDPGIIHIMKDRKFMIRKLEEMNPQEIEHGVRTKEPGSHDPLEHTQCLGYNQGSGEKIVIRLRSENLNGFRTYEGLISVLLHELTHMVWGRHDDNFWALDRELNSQYREFHASWRRTDSDEEFKTEANDWYSRFNTNLVKLTQTLHEGPPTLEALLRIISNLTNFPDEQRYRRVRADHPRIKAASPMSENMLLLLGFECIARTETTCYVFQGSVFDNPRLTLGTHLMQTRLQAIS